MPNMKLVLALCFGLLVSVIAEENNPVSEFEESEEADSNDLTDTEEVEDVKDVGCHVRRCNRGWVCSSTSCYHFNYQRLTAREALNRCQRFGGNLVEINTVSEYNFLYRQARAGNLPKDFWIAFGDALEEGKWDWMNSWTPARFTRWYPGEPNNLRHDEHCAHMGSRFGFKWNDEPCRYKRQYVCEK